MMIIKDKKIECSGRPIQEVTQKDVLKAMWGQEMLFLDV
jgi:hypothetical protein